MKLYDIFINRVIIRYNKYNKQHFLLLTVTNEKMTINATRNLNDEISNIIFKKIGFNICDIDSQEDIDLDINPPICIQGVLFRAHVPILYKFRENSKDPIVINTVEDFYMCNGWRNFESLESYIYNKIRRVMRYRLFLRNSNGEHVYGVSKIKSRQKKLLEFYRASKLDNDNYSEVVKISDEQYESFLETAIERFNIQMSI